MESVPLLVYTMWCPPSYKLVYKPHAHYSYLRIINHNYLVWGVNKTHISLAIITIHLGNPILNQAVFWRDDRVETTTAYPLVNVYSLLLKMAIYSGFTHQKWWCSIVMLVYQRVFVSMKDRWYDYWKNMEKPYVIEDLIWLNGNTTVIFMGQYGIFRICLKCVVFRQRFQPWDLGAPEMFRPHL